MDGENCNSDVRGKDSSEKANIECEGKNKESLIVYSNMFDGDCHVEQEDEVEEKDPAI